MRAVIQRVSEASVTVGGEVRGQIARGLVVLLSVGKDDTTHDVGPMVSKIVGIRCFNDADGKFNLTLEEVGGQVLLISQFTLHGDCRRGRRPSFTDAAGPDVAVPLYENVIASLREQGIQVETGVFGAHMAVQLVNDGPVTLLLDTKKVF